MLPYESTSSLRYCGGSRVIYSLSAVNADVLLCVVLGNLHRYFLLCFSVYCAVTLPGLGVFFVCRPLLCRCSVAIIRKVVILGVVA